MESDGESLVHLRHELIKKRGQKQKKNKEGDKPPAKSQRTTTQTAAIEKTA